MSKVPDGNGSANGNGANGLLPPAKKRTAPPTASATGESGVTFQTRDGVELRGTLVRAARHRVVFEVENPAVTLRLSEALPVFQIVLQGQQVYSGRAVVRSLVDAGSKIVGEATLDEEKVEAFAWGFGWHSVSFGVRARRRKLNLSGAAKDQEFGDGAEAFGTVAVGLQFRDGLVGQFVGDFVGAGQAKDRGIGGLLLGDILARGFAECGGGFLDVEDVVGDLERPADGFAETAQARHIVGGGTGGKRAGRDGSANERGGF